MIPHLGIEGFSIAQALTCARLASAAYQSEQMVEGLLESLVSEDEPAPSIRFHWDSQSDTESFVAATRDAIVIAFRGTEPDSRQDWITDLKFRRSAGVHRGFADAWESIRSRVISDVAEFRNAHQRIFITGHSLGGALAILCAHDLFHVFGHVPTVYTFGQPRVSGRESAVIFGHEFGDRVWRVVNEEDIVPRLPLWIMGYRHIGTEVFLGSDGQLTLDPPLTQKLASDLIGIWQSRGRVLSNAAKDHGMNRYVERLQSHA